MAVIAYDTMILATAGITHFFPMEETGGSTITDVVGGTVGTLNVGSGAIGFSPDLPRFANAGILFRDSNGRCDFDAIMVPSGGFAVEIWVQPSTNQPSASGTVYQIGSDAGTGFSFLFTVDNRILFSILGGGTTFISNWVSGTLYYIVASYTIDGFLTIYLQGSAIVPATAISFTTPTGHSTAGYSASASSDTFNGIIAKLAVYSNPLNALTVLQHWNPTPPTLTAQGLLAGNVPYVHLTAF